MLAVSALLGAVNFAINPNRPALTPDVLGEHEVSVEQARGFEDVLFVDARSEESFGKGTIDGALLLNETQWDTLVEDVLMRWETGQTIVVFCDSLECGASHAVADRLRDDYGLEDVQVMKGGWQAWNE